MKSSYPEHIIINSVEDYHHYMDIDKPLHPLMSVVQFSEANYRIPDKPISIVSNLYNISIKEGAECVMRYGPHHFDFRQGVMSFFKPGQTFLIDPSSPRVEAGYMINFHPDFIQSYPLAQRIKTCPFFNYEVNEALFLSDKEKVHLRSLMEGIKQEYENSIDPFSQDAVISFIDLILVYGERYYQRQFITRKPQNDPAVAKFEKLLDTYFTSGNPLQDGIPHVKYFADKLHMSPNYLSDMLRIVTGQSAQSHIQNKIIEDAKTLLSTSRLTVAEIAYQLGFEQPQSLNRLFKKKTNMSPIQFRQSFN